MPLRDALARMQPYRPARPMRELQAELGRPPIVKLSSNEGAFGPLLEEEGILVRALSGFGAPGAIRVTAGSDEDNATFAAALGRVQGRPHH